MRALRTIAAALTASLVCGCGRGQPGDGSSASRELSLGDSKHTCIDSIETRAIACSGGTARRAGDTLYVRLATGHETTFVNVIDGEDDGGFRYGGRLGRAAFHLIESRGHETYPTWLLMNARTGRTIRAGHEFVVSPDSLRFATAANDWFNCAEQDHPSLDVWRLTDTLPVREWRLNPFDCRTNAGWGPTNPQWRGSDTLEFTRNDAVSQSHAIGADRIEYRARRMLAVRDLSGWRVVTR